MASDIFISYSRKDSTLACNGAKDDKKRIYWSELAIPLFERHLKLFPEDENMRVAHAVLLHHAGRDDDARDAARKLEHLRNGQALYNTASLQCMLADHEVALRTFRKAIEAGFRNMPKLKLFLTEEEDGVGKLEGTPEYEEVREMVGRLAQ